MKKVLSIVMCLCLVLSTFTFVGITASAAKSGYYTYTVSNGEATITDCDTLISGDITIPSTLGGYPVTSIDDAFYNCSKLTSVTIPYSVTIIGDRAFYDCESLRSITIPDSVTSIGDYAFYNCSKLTSVTIPNSVTSIGDYAFYNCESLTSITIGDSVTSIGNSAFYNTGYYNNESNWKNNVLYIDNHLIKAKITISGEYKIKDGTKTIGDWAFYGSASLTSITIPNCVTSIGEKAFYNCSSLISVNITDLKSWCEIEFSDFSSNPLYYAKKLYLNGELLTNLAIPDSVTSIGNSAFSYCKSLTSVTIGDSVKSIGVGAFSSCTSLTSVNITDLKSWCEIEFVGFYSNPLYYAKKLYLNGELLTNLAIPNSVTSISDYAFYDCTSVTSITIPDSVTSIGDYAFSECASLTSVTIPNSVTSIGSSAFEYCTSLTSVNITDLKSWCEIEFVDSSSNPLYYAKKLYLNNELVTDLVIPKGTKRVRDYLFYSCDSIKSITIPDGVTSIGNKAFYGSASLTSITIPDSVTSVGEDAFSNCPVKELIITDRSITITSTMVVCKSITSVTIPKSVTSIGDYAFSECASLTSVTIPDSVTSIGNFAFYLCTSLTNATIPNSVISIGDYAFRNCTSLTSASIENGVISIGDYAFGVCKSLTSITIPDSVTNIGYRAFEGCNSELIIYCSCDNTYTTKYAVSNDIKTSLSHKFIVLKHNETHHWYVCSICDETTNHTLHTFLNYTSNKDATCLENGTETAKCVFCNETHTREDINSSLGHTEVIDKAVAPTCTNTGLTEGRHCSSCGEVLVAQEVVESLGHEYSSEWTVDRAATCSQTGIKSHHCSRCFAVSDETTIEKLPHTTEWFVDKLPTCNSVGHQYQMCTVCEKILTATNISKLEHDYSTKTVKPTCTEQGYTLHTCINCGTSKKNNFTFELGHTSSEWKIQTNSTCSEVGLQVKICVVCDEIISSKQIEMKPHTEIIDKAVAPTCTNTGLTEGKHCSVCNKVLVKQEAVDALGHTEVVDGAVASTCTQTGLMQGKHCSVCNEVLVKQEVVDALGHTVVIDKAVAPSCTKTGLTEGKHCSVCQEVLIKQEVIRAKGHTIIVLPFKAPTCSEAGLTQGRGCLNCDYVLVAQVEISKTNHTKNVVGKKASTYVSNGYTGDKKCSVCGKILEKGKSIAKLKLKTPKFTLKGAKGKFTVKYTSVSGATGFEIKYKIKNGKFKTVKVTTKKSMSKVISKLKKGKYSVQIRAFVKQSGKTANSNWTNLKSVTVK